MTESINYKFSPTAYFLEKSAGIIADFSYEVGFTNQFTPEFFGEGDSKVVSNALENSGKLAVASLPESINFSTQSQELSAIAQTQTQEIEFGNLGKDTDGIFLYSGSQAAFYAPVENFSDLENLEESSLKFYPFKNFAWQVFTEQIFNTIANSYYLGYSSGPIEYSGGWATDADFFEGEVTQATAPERTNLARAYMSTADFIFDESAPSFIGSFSDVVHMAGTSNELITTAFIVEKSKESSAENVIFAAPVEDGELKKGAQYEGSIALTTEWLIIL